MAKEEPGAETGARPADDYEQKFMAAAGPILHRERTVWKLHWVLLLGPIIMAIVGTMGLLGIGDKPMPLAMVPFLFALGVVQLALWASFISLRTMVTANEVQIQFGLFGPRIPIASIEKCEARDYPVLRLSGGIKYIDGAWAYTLWGQGTRVVRMEWTDASGKKRATMVSSPSPDALAAAIQKARSGAGAKSDERARVAPVASEFEESAETAEAAETAEKKRL